MIKSFRDKDTENLFNRIRVKKFEVIADTAFRRLRYLNRAISLKDLSAIPGHHLEKLKDDREGQYSIRINDQYRICFDWIDGDPLNVEITDYH
jgi:proteic killer suppression protein